MDEDVTTAKPKREEDVAGIYDTLWRCNVTYMGLQYASMES